MKHFYHKLDGWASFEEQGKLLETILEVNPIKNNLKIAEIGVFQGRGTALWNVELINRNLNYEYYAIDHFLGSEEHYRMNYFPICKSNLKPIKSKISLINNDSISQASKFEDNYFDIVYIDAAHDYELVKKDLEAWFPKIKQGGIICGDDYVDGWPGVIKAVNEFFNTDKMKVIGRQQWWTQK